MGFLELWTECTKSFDRESKERVTHMRLKCMASVIFYPNSIYGCILLMKQKPNGLESKADLFARAASPQSQRHLNKRQFAAEFTAA